MRTEAQIRQLAKLMEETYLKESEISWCESPADAYNSCITLLWVLGEPSMIDEILAQSHIILEEEVEP